MSDTLVLDFQTNLLKTMQQVNTTLAGTNDLLTKNQKNLSGAGIQAEKMRDYYSDIEKKQKNINTLGEKFTSILKGVASILKSIAGGMLAIFSVAGIIDIIKATMRYQQTFLDLSARMGQGTKAAGAYTSALHGIVQATGMSVENAEALTKALGEFRVPLKDVRALGIATARFSEITGMSVASSARLTGELSRVGKVGASGIKGVLFSMIKVQQTVGLTEGEMEQLGDVITTDTQLLHQMGKTDAEITRFSKSASMLAGAFSSVGLSISSAQEILNKFLDPTKFQDSAFMFAKLGYNLSDVMNGATPGPELAGRLKDLGQQVKGMGMAGTEMAKQLGIPYQELKQMADLPLDKLQKALSDSGGNIDKAMASMQSNQEGAGKALDHIENKIKDAGSQLVDNVMPALTTGLKQLESIVTKVTSNINAFIKPALIIALILAVAYVIYKVIDTFKSRTMRASVDTSEHMKKGIVGAMEMGSQKGSDLMRKTTAIANRQMSEDYKKRVMESAGYSERMMKAEYFQMMSQNNLTGGASRNASATSAYLKAIANGSGATSGLAAGTAGHNANISNRLALTQRDNELIRQGIQFKKQYYDNELTGINSSLAKLKAKENLTEQELVAQKELLAMANKLKKKSDKAGDEDKAFVAKSMAREEAQLNRLSSVQLNLKKEQSLEQSSQLKTELETQRVKLHELTTERNALETAEAYAREQIKSGKLTIFEKTEMIDKQKKLNTELQRAKNETEQQLNLTKEMAESEEKLAKEAKKYQDLMDKPGKSKTGMNAKNPLFGLANLAGSAARDAGSAISFGVAKLGNSMREHAQSLKEHLNPKNIAAGLRSGVKDVGTGLAKAGGAMLMMLFLRPLLEKLQPAIQGLADALMPMIEQLAKIFMPLLNALLPVFITLVNTIMPPLIHLLGWVLQGMGHLLLGIAKLASVFGGGKMLTTMAESIILAGKGMVDTKFTELKYNPVALGSGGSSPTASPAASLGESSPAVYNNTSGNFKLQKQATNVTEKDESLLGVMKDVRTASQQTAVATNQSAIVASEKGKKQYKSTGATIDMQTPGLGTHIRG